MNWDELDHFINKPIWQQQILMLSIVLSLFAVGYYFLILPTKDEQTNYMQIQHTKQSNITLLKESITRYPSLTTQQHELDNLTQQITIKPSSHEFETSMSKQILNSRLKLTSLKKTTQSESLIWQLELIGEYTDFIAFITECSQQGFFFKFHHIGITKKQNQLHFQLWISNDIDGVLHE